MRREPHGRSPKEATSSSAVCRSCRVGPRRANNRSPASVGATLRVVRLSRRTPRLRSSVRITWLSDEADRPSSSAAFLKLRWAETAAKAFRSLSVGAAIIGIFSAAHANSNGLSHDWIGAKRLAQAITPWGLHDQDKARHFHI